jgi:hypothetical protein
MRPVVMLVNWDWFQTNRSIGGRIDFRGRIMSNPLFQHTSPARFTTHLSLIMELRETAFVTAYSIQFYMP